MNLSRRTLRRLHLTPTIDGRPLTGTRRKREKSFITKSLFEDAKAFKNHKEGVISHCFDAETVKLRVVSGDGAQWIQKTIRKTA